VTIATFDRTTDAHLARLALEAERIPCEVADEHMGALYYHVPATGAKLRVHRAYVEQAERILAEQAASAPASDAPDGEEAPAAARPRWIGVALLVLAAVVIVILGLVVCR
jgi:hypothetical protein